MDSGAPFYNSYRSSDGHYMAVGSVEPRFYTNLLRVLGLQHDLHDLQNDRARWPEAKRRIADVFATKLALNGQHSSPAPKLV
ncbi:fatty acid-CoA racemase [Rhodococcus wratislaviensis]|uniref:Fatty acid-CoA racemase n=1 Tax=Rhodococcus wratislaviensis TaxID=44752 RepID=A0AB38F684_RHOWR|nr:hypothetical protein [Rhodococcus wratislaviensis]SPZ35011.1 fatty acid-CoA racemase [Rhodococcus wratislaviensis]